MKERPILFSAPMVKAILGGHKTQTRRVIKPQPEVHTSEKPWGENVKVMQWRDKIDTPLNIAPDCLRSFCPYGQPGDHLWVRETFSEAHYTYGAENTPSSRIVYRADMPNTSNFLGWKPSIFMPRWASRIMLEITDVRVERVQETSEGDVIAEGIDWAECNHSYSQAIGAYADLWDNINAKRGYSWEINPWVWALTFKRVA
jgi:hypothetical protein